MSHSDWLLKVEEQALTDLSNGFKWYQEQKAGLGDAFVAAVLEGFSRIAGNPYYYSKVNSKFRRLALAKFPYIIVYKINDGFILVVAVHHSRRKQTGRFRA